jgi:hypothetical protein
MADTMVQILNSESDSHALARIYAKRALDSGLSEEYLHLKPANAYERVQSSMTNTEPLSRVQTDLLISLLQCQRAMDDIQYRKIIDEKSAVEKARAEAAERAEKAANARAEAVEQLLRSEQYFEKAQLIALRLKGACNARGMMESIQDIIIAENKLDASILKRGKDGPIQVWTAMLKAKRHLLTVAKDVGLRFGKKKKNVVSSPNEAATVLTHIYSKLSAEIHDRRSANGYKSDDASVIIPMTVLHESEVKFLYSIAKAYRFPAQMTDKNGQPFELSGKI